MIDTPSTPDALVVIPARYTSSRLPGKPLADLCGVPLIGRVLERLEPLSGVRVLVATDDARIAAVVEALDGAAVMTSSTCRSGTDRVAEVAAARSEDIVVNVQGDEPFLEAGAIAALIDALRRDPQLTMATLACPLRDPARWRSPSVVKVVTDRQGDALYFSRAPIPWPRDSGDIPPGALQHIGVYAYRRTTLLALAGADRTPLEMLEELEQLRALELGIRIRVVQTGGDWLGVDTPEDLEAARARLSRTPPVRNPPTRDMPDQNRPGHDESG